MNKKLLESKMKLFGDSNVTLAKFLGITPQSLSSKKNESSEFRQSEIVKIKERYKLSTEEVNNIFFA
ncbi:MAG: XRE family transcriptional regulator [Clostridia bacterium]|nr:XRE family transcriptional regulator [Clostridia bacterium]